MMLRVPLAAVLPGPVAAITALIAQGTEGIPDNWLMGAGILTPLLLIIARVLVVDSPVAGTAKRDREARRDAELWSDLWERRANRWYLRAHRLVSEDDYWGDTASGRNHWGDRPDESTPPKKKQEN